MVQNDVVAAVMLKNVTENPDLNFIVDQDFLIIFFINKK